MLGKGTIVKGNSNLQGAEGHIMKHMPCALGCTMCVCEYACVCTCIAHVFTVTSWGPKKGMETKRPCNDCIETCFKVKSRLSF